MSKEKKPDHITNQDFNTIVPQILFRYSLFLGQSEKESYEKIEQFFKQVIEKHEESIQQRQNDETQS